jgi:hypothetical protein
VDPLDAEALWLATLDELEAEVPADIMPGLRQAQVRWN